MEENKFLIPIAIIAAGVLVAGAIYFGGSTDTPQVVSNTNDASKVEIIPISKSDYVLGNRSAELTVVEYSDTECPFCKVFHNTMKEILNTYGDDVAWVYRHFPIAQLHSKAPKEAEATECAAEQGGPSTSFGTSNQVFWNYLDEIFKRTNSNDSLPESELPKIASDIGLDVVAFNTCLNSGKYKKLIEESVANAIKAGARGTPYSVILDKSGKVVGTINGAEPIGSVKAKLDALLK